MTNTQLSKRIRACLMLFDRFAERWPAMQPAELWARVCHVVGRIDTINARDRTGVSTC